jgi:Fur family transcriptional regulator, ferric uptake regulator
MDTNQVTPSELLHRHDLKRTSCREGILAVIMKAGEALSEHEIRDRLEGNYDRTTFYRSFRTLEEHRLIHKITVADQPVKYAVDMQHGEASGGHAHHFCRSCHSVRCLEAVTFTTAPLPEAFTVEQADIVIKGVCQSCNISG